MSIGTVPTIYDSVVPVGDVAWTDDSKADIEDGLSATATLNSGLPSTDQIALLVTSGDLSSACPGLTNPATQVSLIEVRIKAKTTNGAATVSYLAVGTPDSGFIGFQEVDSATLAWFTTDVTTDTMLLHFLETVIANTSSYLLFSVTSTPPVGDNTVSVDAVEVRITYTVTSDDDGETEIVSTLTLFEGAD